MISYSECFYFRPFSLSPIETDSTLGYDLPCFFLASSIFDSNFINMSILAWIFDAMGHTWQSLKIGQNIEDAVVLGWGGQISENY